MKSIKHLALVSLIALLLACSACAKKTEKTKIGILQLLEHDSLNTITSAIEEKLVELGYTEENTTVIFKNGNADATQMAQIIADFITDDVDIVIAVATNAAMCAVTAADADIPVIFAAVSDPVGSGLVANDKAPDGNVTGVSDAIHVSDTLSLAMKIKDIKKMGFIYTTSEASAINTVKRAEDYLTSVNVPYAYKAITDVADLETAFNALIAEGCDAFYLPDDNNLAAKGPVGQYAALCLKAKVPLYAGADSEVADGALFCAGITYVDLGHRVAEMASSVLKGASVASLPVDYMASPVYYYVNKTTLEALGLTLPTDITSSANFTYVKESA